DDALIPVVDALWRFACEHPGLYAASVPAPGDDDPELQRAADQLLGVLLDVLAGYGLSGDDALHAVRAVRAILHGFLSLDAAGGFGMPLDVEESFRRLVASFVRGLGEHGTER
ncbi:MAG: TetR-like C-terminal domain-containing protein, partial [Proteobacteria bacterium]|nr:TetR-like C-terminal domain-containing protein [Pseudomonadota bacterium]